MQLGCSVSSAAVRMLGPEVPQANDGVGAPYTVNWLVSQRSPLYHARQLDLVLMSAVHSVSHLTITQVGATITYVQKIVS